MNDKQRSAEEFIIKEYPNYTHWLEGSQAIGIGNLILTSRRLVFLNQLPPLTEAEIEHLQKFSQIIDRKFSN